MDTLPDPVAASAVDVWCFDLSSWSPDPGTEQAAMASVGSVEAERLAKFVFAKDRLSSLAGRLLLHLAVARGSGDAELAPADVRLVRTAKGKPVVAGPPSATHVSVNISHQDRWVVLGRACRRRVGVDVMTLHVNQSDLESFFADFASIFTEREWRWIRGAGPSRSSLILRFYTLWTLKESYVKALGEGIGFGMKRLDFDVVLVDEPERAACHAASLASSITLLCDGVPQASFCFGLYALDGNAVLALAAECDLSCLAFTTITPSELEWF